MTAHAIDVHLTKSLDAGMNGHLSKPIDPGKLNEVLLQWIKPSARDSAHENAKADRQVSGVSQESMDLQSEEPLPDLPGIDMEDGLARTGGRQELFTSLLIKFSAGHKNTVQEIKSALEYNDREKAARLAHTLKGVAGVIGARELNSIAAELEDAIRDEEAVQMLSHDVRMLGSLLQVSSGISAQQKLVFSEYTMKLIKDDGPAYRSAGKIPLKGISEPVEVFELLQKGSVIGAR